MGSSSDSDDGDGRQSRLLTKEFDILTEFTCRAITTMQEHHNKVMDNQTQTLEKIRELTRRHQTRNRPTLTTFNELCSAVSLEEEYRSRFLVITVPLS